MLLVQDHLQILRGKYVGAVRFESSGWQKKPLMARYDRFGLVWLPALCNRSLGILDRSNDRKVFIDRKEDSIQPVTTY